MLLILHVLPILPILPILLELPILAILARDFFPKLNSFIPQKALPKGVLTSSLGVAIVRVVWGGVIEGVVWGVGDSAWSRNWLGGVVKGVRVGVGGGIWSRMWPEGVAWGAAEGVVWGVGGSARSQNLLGGVAKGVGMGVAGEGVVYMGCWWQCLIAEMVGRCGHGGGIWSRMWPEGFAEGVACCVAGVVWSRNWLGGVGEGIWHGVLVAGRCCRAPGCRLGCCWWLEGVAEGVAWGVAWGVAGRVWLLCGWEVLPRV